MCENIEISDVLLDIYWYQKELKSASSIEDKKILLDNIKKAEELLMKLKQEACISN